MENKHIPDDFEKLIRQELGRLNDKPDDTLWADIAARQQQRNVWLRVRYYARFVVPLVLLLGIGGAGWWYHAATQQPAHTPHITPTPYNPGPVIPDFLPPVAGASSSGEGGAFSDASAAAPMLHANKATYLEQYNRVPAATVRFLAETGLQYVSPVSGTTVRIPANALRYPDGNPARGLVELTFREYRSAPDFAASALPMHYSDPRGDFFFNSGGMFEVRVDQRGQALELNDGQTMEVDFTATRQLEDASLYYYNEKTGAWEYRPDPAFGQAGQSLPPVVSEDIAIRDNTGGCLPDYPDLPAKSDPAEWMQQGVRTGYELATGKMPMPLWFRKNAQLSYEHLLNGLDKGSIRIVRHHDNQELFFPEDITGQYTELQAFKDCYFTRTIDGKSSEVKLDPDAHWQRITIYKEQGNVCHFTLYDDKLGQVKLYAHLLPSVGNTGFDVDKVMAEYTRLRNERQNNLEKLVLRLKQFLKVAPVFQEEKEWCMSDTTWLNYFDNNHPQMAERYSALLKQNIATDKKAAEDCWSNWRARLRELHFNRNSRGSKNGMKKDQALKYALRLTDFGVYNCDQVFRLATKEFKLIQAAFQTGPGATIVPAMVAVMERQTRLFFTMPSSSTMLLLKDRNLDFVILDRNGRSYHLPAERYQRLTAGLNSDARSATFEVDDVTDRTRSPREWADLLDL